MNDNKMCNKREAKGTVDLASCKTPKIDLNCFMSAVILLYRK